MTDLVANISFVVPPEDPRAEAFTFATVLATGEALHVAPFSTKIEDMRPRLGTENAPKLVVDGFAAENVPYDGFASGKEGWEDAYSEKMAEVRSLALHFLILVLLLPPFLPCSSRSSGPLLRSPVSSSVSC